MDKFCIIFNCASVLLSISCLIANAMIHRYYWCVTFAVLALCNAWAAFAVYLNSRNNSEKNITILKRQPVAPKDNEYYWCINDMLNPVSKIFDAEDPEDWARVRSNNCFRTQELARQAAETIKRILEQFHKDNQQ